MLGEVAGLIVCSLLVAVFSRAALDESFFWRHLSGWVERNYSFWSRLPLGFLTGGSEAAYARRVRIAWGIGGLVMAAACVAWAISLIVRWVGR